MSVSSVTVRDESDVDVVTVEVNRPVSVVSVGIPGAAGPAGPSGLAAQITGEVPSGSIDGSNATFQTEFEFVPESVDVTVNGLRQKRVDDFNTSGTQTITLVVSPEIGTNLLVNYLRA